MINIGFYSLIIHYFEISPWWLFFSLITSRIHYTPAGIQSIRFSLRVTGEPGINPSRHQERSRVHLLASVNTLITSASFLWRPRTGHVFAFDHLQTIEGDSLYCFAQTETDLCGFKEVSSTHFGENVWSSATLFSSCPNPQFHFIQLQCLFL